MREVFQSAPRCDLIRGVPCPPVKKETSVSTAQYLKEARKMLAAAIKAGDVDQASALRDLIEMHS